MTEEDRLADILAIVVLDRRCAEILWRVAAAARLHNQTPTGKTRACLAGCILCVALADLDDAVEDR